MTKKIKRGLALFAAGVLLTSSAAAYAAQLPNENAAAPALSSSSQQELGVSIELISYTLTSDRIQASFHATPTTGMGSLQFRAANYHVLVETEDGADTSSFQTVVDKQQFNGSSFDLDEAISIEKGERVRVRLTVSGSAFYGYTYVGDATGTQDFYFTL